MMNFKQLEEYLLNLIYSDDEKKYIVQFENMNDRYDKQRIMRCLSTFFMLDPKFMDLAFILSKLTMSHSNFKDIVQYVREFSKKSSKNNIWFLTGNKYDYYSKLLISKLPRVFPDELTTKLFIMTYPDECVHICKFIDDPKYVLVDRAKELFEQLVNANTNTEVKENMDYTQGHGRYILNNLTFTNDLTKSFAKELDLKFNCKEDHFCYACKYKKNSYVLFDELINDSNRYEVDVLFMGMNPYKDEVAMCRPFSGKAGKHLRNLISNSNMQYLNIVIFNTVPCFIENNGDPEEDIVSRCANKYASEVIRYLKPKVVVFLGDVALKGFYYILRNKNVDEETAKTICKNVKHNIIKMSNNYVAHTYHPSYLNYNHNLFTYEKMISMFNQISSHVRPQQTIAPKQIVQQNSYNNQYIRNNQPKKYLKRDPKEFFAEIIKDNYWLTNLVFLDENKPDEKYTTKRAIARFRNLNDINDTFLVDVSDLINYEYYVLKDESDLYDPIKDFSKVVKKEVSFLDYINKKYIKDDINKQKSYEGDIDEFDYAMFKFGETCNYKEVTGLHKVCFTDIETLSEDEIPDEKNCSYPIPIVTSIIDNTIYVYIAYSVISKYIQTTKNELEKYVNESIEELIKDYFEDKVASKLVSDDMKKVIKVFNDEVELIKNTIKLWSSADVLTGWNSFYDLNYVGARSKLLGIDKINLENFSTNTLMHKKYNQHNKNIIYTPHRSYRYGFYLLPGMTMIDMLEVYKNNHKLESYSLDFVSRLEFENVKKMNIEGNFIDQLKNNLKLFIKYNINDTFLTYLIDAKKKLIQPLMGLSSISFCTLTTVSQNLKLIDGFLLKYARKRNCVVRNKKHFDESFQKIGGYVRSVGKDQNKLIACFDVASMYPNIIISFNISFDSNIGHIKGQFIDNEQDLLDKVESVSYFVNKLKNNEVITEEDISSNNRSFIFVYDPLSTNRHADKTSYELAKEIFENDYLITPRGTVFRNKPDGLAVEMMKDLLQQRKGYKKKAAETGDQVAELFSLTYKLAANSYYGANGAEDFRFFNPYNAETITLIGQMIIRTVQVITNDYIIQQVNN